ncbi:transglycosylase family protein [Aciditerrimonas ferrireducens]|uniref:transglycosylase family protein n=1 Tax=Aciditerrimonas ferrireducens TaxID=667306 RepID=UPI0020066CF6|nr:transglycosylase family protein [Aciditerrimonas ferrireducens]MCK4176073.1 transglycosylase family protein [Aciditerrimonas ferrireducens]
MSDSLGPLTNDVQQLGEALHRSGLALAADRGRVEHLEADLADQRAELGRLKDRLAATRAQLRQVAVRAYVTGAGSAGSFGPVTALLANSELQAAARSEYQDLVDGDLATAVARWRVAQVAVERHEARLDALLASAQAAQAQATAQDQQLTSQLSQERTLLAQVQAAEEAAAQQAAAQQAAAARAATPQASAPSPQPTGQGAPLAVSAQLVSPPSPTPPAPTSSTSDPSSATGSGPSSLAEDLARLRACESGDDYTANTGNGYYGAYQFSLQTWQALGYSGLPSAAPPAEQDQAAARLAETAGWGQWPVCSALLGLQGRASPPGG